MFSAMFSKSLQVSCLNNYKQPLANSIQITPELFFVICLAFIDTEAADTKWTSQKEHAITVHTLKKNHYLLGLIHNQCVKKLHIHPAPNPPSQQLLGRMPLTWGKIPDHHPIQPLCFICLWTPNNYGNYSRTQWYLIDANIPHTPKSLR